MTSLRRRTSITGAIFCAILILAVGGPYLAVESANGFRVGTFIPIDMHLVPAAVSLPLWFLEAMVWAPVAVAIYLAVLWGCIRRVRRNVPAGLFLICGCLIGLLAVCRVSATVVLWQHGWIQIDRAGSRMRYTIEDVLSALLSSVVFVAPPLFIVGAGVAERLVARRNPLLCRTCGYDLRGSLEAGRCPECGLTFDAAKMQTQLAKKLEHVDGSEW